MEDKQERNRQAELHKVAVKTGQRETNVYTYWPDGSVYQWENRMEQVDEAKFSSLHIEQQTTANKKGTRIDRVPYIKPIIILIVLLLLIGLYIYNK